MKRDVLIQKWLDHDLNADELEAFKSLEDYDSLIKLNQGLNTFKAPEYNTSEALAPVLHAITSRKKSPIKWMPILIRVAAVFVICFGIYYYSTTLDTSVTTLIAQKESVVLPDESNVVLNAKSSLVYNKRDWDDSRDVNLKGEAFFKVAKGSTFNVNTTSGTITVFGTQFNVKQRPNYFEVICYEGVVGVTYNSQLTKLNAGDSFLIMGGKLIAKEKENNTQPSWLNNESYFKSLPFREVLAEFERQYDLKIDPQSIDTDQLFTGSFSHKNLEIALKSITLPLQITYSKTDRTITLKRE